MASGQRRQLRSSRVAIIGDDGGGGGSSTVVGDGGVVVVVVEEGHGEMIQVEKVILVVQ